MAAPKKAEPKPETKREAFDAEAADKATQAKLAKLEKRVENIEIAVEARLRSRGLLPE